MASVGKVPVILDSLLYTGTSVCRRVAPTNIVSSLSSSHYFHPTSYISGAPVLIFHKYIRIQSRRETGCDLVKPRLHFSLSLAIFSKSYRFNLANIERFTSECLLGIPRIILTSVPTTRTDAVSHASVACRRGTSASNIPRIFLISVPTIKTDAVSHASVACRRGTSASRISNELGLSIPTRIVEG